MEWCKEEAKKKNLKDCDYWGGLVIDEMKIEVNKPRCKTQQIVFDG